MLKQALLVAVLTVPVAARAATTVRSDWSAVQAVAPGTDVHINARTRHTICTLKSVGTDTLVCNRNTGVGTKDLTFQRSEITAVKLARRGRSAVFGAAIAAGAGASIGAIEGSRSNYFAVKGAFAMIYAFAGAFAGAPFGYLTDFSATTIYRAP
jgi:hypothetical protein